jgi:hypothetical protein
MSDKMKRLALALLFVSLILVLNTYHYLNHDQYEEYLDEEDVIKGVEGTVSIYGTVINKSNDGFTLRIRYESESKILNVLSPEIVDSRDRVEVLGVLEGDEIIPEKIIVYKQWSYYSLYIRSVIGLFLVVYLFFTYWTFDIGGMRFRRRNDNA